MESINCTTPWLLNFARLEGQQKNFRTIFNNFRLSEPEARICPPNSSAQANKIYRANRYLHHTICQKPCTDMNIKLGLRGRIQGASTVTFVLHTKIQVLSEVMPKTLLMLVAELGGYLGLTLGVSLLDLKMFVQSSYKLVNAKHINIYNIPKQ